MLLLPVWRHQVHLVRVGIFFMLMLAGPLLTLGRAVAAPGLHLWLYHTERIDNYAFDHLGALVAQFPDSTLPSPSPALPPQKLKHRIGLDLDTLVIPGGEVLHAAWELWLVLLYALALQAAALLADPRPKVSSAGLIMLVPWCRLS